eukprot:Platyproteum_vivax@DN10183_c0_g1_i1.p1
MAVPSSEKMRDLIISETTPYDELQKRFLDTFAEVKASIFALVETNIVTMSRGQKDALKEYYCKCFDCTVWGGKALRGLTVVYTACTILKGLTQEEFLKVSILGWIVEFVQAFFLIVDDIMDESHTRRGHPCWFRRPEIGQANAVNDGIMVEALTYLAVDVGFAHHPSKPQIIDLVHQMIFATICGQHLDTNAQPGTNSKQTDEKIDISKLTMELYLDIVRNKTALYSFFMPVRLGMLFCNRNDEAECEKVLKTSLAIGEFFQIQDDYLDCFADEETLGKVGTDIQDAKCSWLAVKAVEIGKNHAKEVILKHYGRDTPEDIAKIRELFAELKLEQEYQKFEDESQHVIISLSNALEKDLCNVFNWILRLLYKRCK